MAEEIPQLQSLRSMPTICNNCKNPNVEKYCPKCGQAAVLTRIDKHYISHEIEHLAHVERGVIYTIVQLMLRPGATIRSYINENRSRHMKPVPFLILTSLLYTIIAHFFHADEIYNEKEKLLFGKSTINDIQHWVQTHYGYANIIMGIFIALFVKLLFKKYKYNLFEITVLLCFVMGQGMVYLTIEAFFIGIISKQTFIVILTAVSLVYPTWAIGQFFDSRKVSSYIKSFLAYLLGYVAFYLAIIVVGLTLDLILGAI